MAVSISGTWIYFAPDFEPTITTLVLIISLVISGKEVLSVYNISYKPEKISISLLGDKYSGKSVYITVLVDELQRLKHDLYSFSPNGSNTIKKNMYFMNMLMSGQWLPLTRPSYIENIFYYKGLLIVKKLLLSRSYLIEIGDHSGEDFFKLTEEEKRANWFHESKYFDYVLNSKIIILIIDCLVYTSNAPDFVSTLDWQINRLIAALQIYSEEKGKTGKKKIEQPVCLFFLKSDLLKKNNIDVSEVSMSSDRLIDVCNQRCKFFKYFFVSSTGDVCENGDPPKKLNPDNVIEPILWAVSKYHR